MENLEQYLIVTWDAIACLIILELLPKLTSTLTDKQLPLLSSFFQRAQVEIAAACMKTIVLHTRR